MNRIPASQEVTAVDIREKPQTLAMRWQATWTLVRRIVLALPTGETSRQPASLTGPPSIGARSLRLPPARAAWTIK